MKKLLAYLNPLAHLGINKYSVFFPLIFSLIVCVLSEIFAYGIVKDPNIVGVYIIFINVASIIYFAFRDGIRGGFISVLISIFYYLYIIYTRRYSGAQLISGLETTGILTALYLLLAGVIGWLKQTIDELIVREANQRRRLEAIIEQLPVGIIITDEKAVVVQTNKRLEQILGTEVPNGFVIGKDAPLLGGKYKDKDIAPSQSPLAQALASGKTISGREFKVSRKDGRQLFTQVNASPIRNREGKIVAAASIITDITSQKEMEARKDEFINMASHELKTPITSMKLFIESLLIRMKGNKDERSVKTLTSIKYQTEKLQELVADLLDVSRIQTGKLSFNKEYFEVGNLIEESIDELQATTKLHKINFLKKKAVRVYADRFRVTQVLTNLLTNAIKYSPEGGNINVGLKSSEGKAIISVADQGIGVSKDEQSKIFERLYQVSDHHVKTFPGLGMGLYISKEIIKRHKGNIWVESTQGKGSIFYFTLPLKKN